jgi:hypothetical protein
MEIPKTQTVRISRNNGHVFVYSTIEKGQEILEHKLVGEYNSTESAARGKLHRRRAMSAIRNGVVTAEIAATVLATLFSMEGFSKILPESDALKIAVPIFLTMLALYIPLSKVEQARIRVGQQYSAIREFALSGERNFARTYPLTRRWKNF